MGTALAGIFRQNGCRVVTSVQGRSDRTKQLVLDASLEVLPSLEDVVRVSTIVLSTTPPQRAVGLAKGVAGMPSQAGTLYVDANSIAPNTTKQIQQIVNSAGMTMIDMAIRGLADKLVERGAIYLSGEHVSRLQPLLSPIETENLGQEVGSASLLKMLMGGLSKGIATLVMELGVGADRAGILDRFLQGLGRYYPDVLSAMDSVLPTYPQHAGRRAHELEEVTSCLSECGVESQVVAGGSRLLHRCAETDLGESSSQLQTATVEEIIRALAHQSSFLSPSTQSPLVDAR